MAGLPTFLMPGGPPLPQLPSKRKQFSTSWQRTIRNADEKYLQDAKTRGICRKWISNYVDSCEYVQLVCRCCRSRGWFFMWIPLEEQWMNLYMIHGQRTQHATALTSQASSSIPQNQSALRHLGVPMSSFLF